MTDTRQHQQPLQHAIDAADNAILQAQDAEHQLQRALQQADPQRIQSAQAALAQAKINVQQAQEQLKSFPAHEFGTQTAQNAQQLSQAAQDLTASEAKSHMPKQIR
ncbi:hypothetical protein ABE504_17985 [Paenibacillus oryzisoli]|uniref:hypothetical protein n=1 Tax=Paenibacillus oryzisoli TaxID=1850517 RepID=UPI003D29C79E